MCSHLTFLQFSRVTNSIARHTNAELICDPHRLKIRQKSCSPCDTHQQQRQTNFKFQGFSTGVSAERSSSQEGASLEAAAHDAGLNVAPPQKSTCKQPQRRRFTTARAPRSRVTLVKKNGAAAEPPLPLPTKVRRLPPDRVTVRANG